MLGRIIVAATAALALTAGAATPAAADVTPLEAAKRITIARIDGRLAALRIEQAAVRNAARLTDAHRHALNAIFDHDVQGLTALKTKVQGETTLEAVRAEHDQ
jgi:hypothetical protein